MGQKIRPNWSKLRLSPYVEISVFLLILLGFFHLWNTQYVAPIFEFSDVHQHLLWSRHLPRKIPKVAPAFVAVTPRIQTTADPLQKFDTFSEIQNLPPISPHVLNYIKKHYIYPPALQPYKLASGLSQDPSQFSRDIRELFGNKRNGIFMECGANDGEFLSNTLGLERNQGWTGLLIEAHPGIGKDLLAKHRKAWFANVCLSPYNNITQINFKVQETVKFDWQNGVGKLEMKDDPEKPIPAFKFVDYGALECFPLISVLRAVNLTHVDFFSFDVQGLELKILKTLPWDDSTFTIDHILVENNIVPEGKLALRGFLESKGYKLWREVGDDYLFQRIINNTFKTKLRTK